ncbi:MAG: signal peptidase I [Clostridia bacterium]|nr:signal peptidase I [Clostridia bacterium]
MSKKTIKTIWNAVTWTIVILVVVFALLLVGVRLFGYQVFTVLSGSMEPTYHVGSLVYVDYFDKDPEQQKSLKVGDPVTYMAGEKTVVTHRITAVVVDEEDPSIIRYATKGDNNATGDQSLLHYKNVIGKPVFSIPYLGYVADYVQNPPGLYVAIALGVVVVLLAFLPDILFPEEKEQKKEEELPPPAPEADAAE